MIYSYIQLIWFDDRRKIKEMISKIELVFNSDHKMGIVRHVDAGYEKAIEFAKENDIKVPMMR